ncbi:aminotransferase class I/II-fold pyridoxal phosphate-dependent enzyme [Lewinella sp. W8]|uniref:aminotransferase class I/II-fold pyridoxal phosphate-dependent enzyme n=1 Tax=Lewinella sp. W8 TaxID=2528208 RepID=UPI00156498ED|nr:aminotransferase class I/II-fold pyridoxal phosphate-dependent enzyme [Lewinella sp. W8]
MQSPESSLSRRGRRAASHPLRADFDLFAEAMDNHYHPEDNPEGCLPLCIAENLLNWEEMEAKLRGIAAAGPTPDWVASYTSILGAPAFREAVAGFVGKHIAGAELSPERFAVSAGATATIEMTAFLLGDPGDVAVIPAPAYAVYSGDIGNRAGMQRYDLHPADEDPVAPATVSRLRVADLERAHAELGDRFRMLILTTPNNPTGQIYAPEQLRELADWCIDHKIHLVVNEIYALSLIDQRASAIASDYDDVPEYTSVLPLLVERDSPYLHWWYSFSKDFGISGLRVGLIYTHNTALLEAWGNSGAPSITSNYVQWLLSELLQDHDWVAKYQFRNRQRLTTAYATVIATLKQHDINYAPAAGSLFVWFDCSRFLTDDTDAAEQTLWRGIFADTGLLLTAPDGMAAPRRGWFRMVYSGIPQDYLAVATERLGRWLAS